jgi:hypothetical protein
MRKSMRVLGAKIAIKSVSKLPMGDEHTLGVADVLDQVTHVHKNLSKFAAPKILIHEAGHHAFWHSGVSQSISPELEEVLCQVFTRLYYELKEQGF